jgi:hypothetical protein
MKGTCVFKSVGQSVCRSGVIVLATFSVVCSTQSAVFSEGFESIPISNSQFETYQSGSMGAWTVGANGVDAISGYWAPASGAKSLDLNALDAGWIETTISGLVSGSQYSLSFMMGANPQLGSGSATRSLDVLWNGSSAGSFSRTVPAPVSPPMSYAAIGWQSSIIPVLTATGPTAVLRFASTTAGACGPTLDDIQLTLVPEPYKYGLVAVLGLLGVAGYTRMSRKTA